MSIDNVFDQVEALITSDESQYLPETVDKLLSAIGHIPGTAPVVSLIRHETVKRRAENSDLMLRTAWQELKRVSFRFDKLDDDFRAFAESDEMKRLILDAVEKSENLRDRKRVERIAKILSHAITIGPASDLDKAEELMRVARDLSDQDILALRHLYESQFKLLETNKLGIDVDEINKSWATTARLRIPGLFGSELDSIFLKLQGLGLVTIVERRNTALGPNERPFALLAKGADFIRYVNGAVEGDHFTTVVA
jgi:hypothetical protein